MRMLIMALCCLPLTTQAALGQCTQSNNRHANVGSVQLVLQGFPSSGPIEQGMGMWNASSCNDGGDDFPYLQLTPGAEATLTVTWNPGFNPLNEFSCGRINHDAATIDLFGRVRDPQGFERNCALDGIVADNLAHEIGHYFGMTESSCSGYIMFGVQFQSNGAYTQRNVQGQECSFADDANSTQMEINNENSSDPFCDAYCWTSCVNGVCPERTVDTGCPILIDLDGNGLRLAGLGDAVSFDLDFDTRPESTAWTAEGEQDAFLALDRNENGVIDHGGELFGNSFRLADGDLAPHGYVALAELDLPELGGNGDGVLDWRDGMFSSLLLWVDLNHNAISEPEELWSVDQGGLTRFALEYRESRRRDRYGNEFRYLGLAWRKSHAARERRTVTWDVFFVRQP
jgi:hypothetical protein